MPEDYEIEEAEKPDLDKYLGIARRRSLHFLLPLLVGFLTIAGISWVLKPRYKSTTAILVEQPSMPKNYVLPNVSEDLQEQLASIQQQVMSRTNLLRIIREYHLYASKGKGLTDDQKVAQMIRDIDVELVHDARGEEITAFSIGYTADSPAVAQGVTQQLSTAIMDQNLAIRQRESQNTTDFLDQQLKAAAQNLAEQDAKVRQYEATHQGALPDQQQSNMQILASLQQQLQSEQDGLNSAQQQRAYYQTLVEQYRALRGPVKGADGTPVDVATLDQILEKDRAQLADLSLRYTDSYPDVQALKREIARTEKRREQALAAVRTAPPGSGAGKSMPDAEDSAQNSPLLQVQGQLQANQLEISHREQAITQLKARINDYQARLGAEPASEQEMADLTRGYQQSQKNYNDLLEKRDDSQMATNMEQMQKGERFSVLTPPTMPWKPDFPNHLKFCGMGIGAGILLGLLSVAGFELADDRMYSDKDIRKVLPVAVIAEVPEIVSADEERSTKRKSALRWVTAAVVAVVILMGTAISALRP